MGRPSRYVHGSEPEEQARLSLMNRLLNVRHMRALSLAGGEKVLDFGCGTGELALELARAVGASGGVVAIERDERQLAAARERLERSGTELNLELRQGDAFDPPLAQDEWGRFDVAHTRFLLEHVPDPLEVVRAMVRAVRPGGRIVVCDDDHDILRLYPPAPALVEVWRAYMRAYESVGNDPLVGRKLVSLLHAAGARPARIEQLFFGACAGEEALPVAVANLRGILEGAREAIQAHLAPARFDQGLAELEAWAGRPDAAFWYAICWAEGRRPQP